ncbi:hypothetical protein Hypma_007883 [Hypsizygus marmoreus]|uniref:DUF300-domain-containing protein n=1 Tax=Hypsizygus marmoreus TaxID=39966 RepID=A0A369K0T8_HYPMA|nr:hypothetical protein Hypma_007883 [Hypsizygus marmoreus]
MGNCPSDNTNAIDQSSFWGPNGVNWDTHRIGLAVAGSCTLVTIIISSISILLHARSYTNPRQQRQILRILFMPPIYSFISFLSYRFFRAYTYYSLIQVVYEAITLSAFLLLLIEFVADSTVVKDPKAALARKEKRRLMLPLCCWRYRPTKAYFMYAVKWAVLQYVIVRPAVSIASIICEAFNVLCPSEGFSPKYANVYLSAIDFVSISVALYGLLLFYSLTKEELKGRRPLAKFLAIKLIVFFTFYQSFVFSALNGKVIHATEYWTVTNISNGLNAFAICIEMIFFSAFMLWAYPWKEYKRKPGTPATRIWRPLLDCFNYSDFVLEIVGSVQYYFNRSSLKPPTARGPTDVPDFGETFGVGGYANDRLPIRRERGSPNPSVSGELHVIGSSFDLSSPPPYTTSDAMQPPPRHPDLKKDFAL